MPDFVDAAQGGIVVLLAAIVSALGIVVGFLFSVILKELRSRASRAEALTDTANMLLDKAVEGFQVALNELRAVKPRTRR